MAAITWRNVAAPDFTGASRMMETGADRLSQAFGNVQNMLDTHRQTQIQNWEATKQSNTQAALAKILGVGDMDSYNALRETINPTALQQENGSQIDLVKVMEAMNSRDDAIRQDTRDNWAFKIDSDNNADRDIVNQIKALEASGDRVGAAKLREQAQFKSSDSAVTLNEYGFDRSKEYSAERRANESHGSSMATAAQNRKHAAYNHDRQVVENNRQDEVYARNEQDRKWTDALVGKYQDLTENTSLREDEINQAMQTFAQENNIPNTVTAAFDTSGNGSKIFQANRQATAYQKGQTQQAVDQLTREFETNPEVIANRSQIAAADKKLKELPPEVTEDKYLSLADVSAKLEKRKIKSNAIGLAKADADIDNVHDQLPDLYAKVGKEMTELTKGSGINIPEGLRGYVVDAAIDIVGTHDRDDEGYGELDMEEVEKVALRLAGERAHAYVEGRLANSVKTTAQRIIDGHQYQYNSAVSDLKLGNQDMKNMVERLVK
jgi:hypothetical protein